MFMRAMGGISRVIDIKCHREAGLKMSQGHFWSQSRTAHGNSDQCSLVTPQQLLSNGKVENNNVVFTPRRNQYSHSVEAFL